MNITKLIMASAMKMAEKQANVVRQDVMEHIQSDEFETALAEKLDAKINIPFVKADKEAKIFRDFVDVVTDLMAGIIGKK